MAPSKMSVFGRLARVRPFDGTRSTSASTTTSTAPTTPIEGRLDPQKALNNKVEKSFEVNQDQDSPPEYTSNATADIEDVQVKIWVGPEQVAYQVAERLLCDSSAVFQARRFSRSVRLEDSEALMLPFELRDTETETFEAYLRWLYNRKLVNRSNDLSLGKLYVLACKIEDVLLHNTVIDAFLVGKKGSANGFGSLLIELAYTHCGTSSQLRRMLLDDLLAVIDIGNAHWLRDAEADLPKAFYVDVAFGLVMHEKTLLRVGNTDKCKYHEHNADVPHCS